MDYEWRGGENMKNGEDGCSETRGEKRRGGIEVEEKKD